MAGSKDASQPVGEVGLRELIALALENDPELVALRLNVPVEEAKKRAAVQWRDPEIRFGYDTDDNLQLDQPYTRSGRETQTVTGDSSTAESGGRNGDVSQTGSSTETRTTTFQEKVIPGVDSDRIIRTETENRTTTGATTNTDIRGTTNETSQETETFRTKSDETRYDSRDRLARDESAVVKVRFWLPKPWEMKALVNQAAKEVDLANYEITAAERRVILRVREDYEKLQYLYKRLQTMSSKIRLIEEHVAREQALLGAGGEFTLDQLSFDEFKVPGLKLAIDSANMELKNAKRELAASVGLADGSRIRVTDRLLRSTIDLQGTDLDYLTRMAYAHRGEVGILEHAQAIAESELDIVKSKSIPWFSFVEAGYARDTSGGDHRNDNYGIQFGVTLPLFTWLAKDEEVVQARIESYYGSIAANKKNIANEVAEAFRSVKEAAKHRTRAEDAVANYTKKLEAEAKRLEASEDLAAKEKLRYDVESQRDDLYKYILDADRLYNQSLIRLEQALGADLDQVFNYKFEALAGAGVSSEVTAAAAESSTASAPRAKPVPKEIKLEGGAAPDTQSEASRPKRLLHSLLGDDSSSASARKGSDRKRFRNR